MPPSESVRRDSFRAAATADRTLRSGAGTRHDGGVDEVDDYISARRRARARRAATAGLDVLSADAEFTWESNTRGSAEVVDSASGAAWRAAAAARHASPRALDRSLDEWGDRFAAVSPSPVAAPAPVPAPARATATGRRTVVITGRGAERYPAPRRGYSASLRRHERAGFKPDRLAMWAVLLGVALLLGAAATSHAAMYVTHAALHAAH